MYKRHHGILPNMFYSLFTVTGTSPDVIHVSLIYSMCPKVSSVNAVEQFYPAEYHFTTSSSTE